MSAPESITLSSETIAAVERWQAARDAYARDGSYGTELHAKLRDDMAVQASLALLHLGIDRARAR